MSIQISDMDVLDGVFLTIKGNKKEAMQFFAMLEILNLDVSWVSEPDGDDFIEGCLDIGIRK